MQRFVNSESNIASTANGRTCECRLWQFHIQVQVTTPLTWTRSRLNFDLHNSVSTFLALTALLGTLDVLYSSNILQILKSQSRLHIFSMAPNTRILGPQEPIISCLEPSCIRRFYNRTGRSNHMRSKHPQFVPDLQQQPEANAPSTSSNSIPNSQMSSPPSYNMSLDSRSQSRGSNHNSADELPVDDLDIPFYGGELEYQHLNQSPEPSNAGSYDRAPSHDPTMPCINRTYHPIINGGFLQVVLLTIFHIY
jgi:hypothetical protein